MSENYDLNSLFHPNVEIGDQTLKNVGEYAPTADKGQSGVYKSIIRFVAWWQDPEHSMLEKWVCWLVDPVTNRGRFVDCPSSVGKPSILQDMFFKLRKSESIQEQKKSMIFSRRHMFTTLIQVIKDDQNKEAEGKVLIWRFGKKIYDKIQAEKKPLIGEPHEPFDLIDGKAFALIITKVADFNNYDQSRFLDKKIPLLLPTKEGKLQQINEKTLKETVFNFLKENSPDLKKYEYKEWDQETHDYVNQVIVAVTGVVPSTAYADVRNAPQKSTESKSDSVKTGITSTDLSLDDFDINSGLGTLPNLELPDLDTPNDTGIAGDLDEVFKGL